jgi:hypothetical protein
MPTRRVIFALSLILAAALLVAPSMLLGWIGILLVFIPLLIAIVIVLKPH